MNYINWWYKSKYSISPRTFSNLQKTIYEKPYTKATTFQAATIEFLSKILNRNKISNEDFNLCEAETSLDEFTESINSQTNNKSPGNDGLKGVFYKQFSNELGLVLLDVYGSCGKLGTISVLEQESYLPYTKKVIRDVENYRPISFLDLYYKIHTTILKGYLR